MSFRRILLLVGLLLLVMAAAGYFFEKTKRERAARSGPQRAAIVSFENQTGDPDLDWAATYIAAAAMKQLETLPRTTLFRAEHASEAVARGAAWIMSGRVVRERGKIRVRWTVEDVRAHTIHSGEAAAPEVAAALAARVRPGSAVMAAEVHGAGAEKAYAQGLAETDRGAAAAAFEKCVAADPASGWCWLALADAVARGKGREAALPVLERSRVQGKGVGELSRARLDLLEAILRNDMRSRRSALERVARVLSGDAETLAQLAAVYTAGREFGRAVGVFERALQAEPENPDLWNTYAYTLAYAGRFGEARKAVERYGQIDTQSANPADSSGEIYLMSGDFRAAASSFLASHQKDANFNQGAALEKAALARWLAGDSREAGGLAERYVARRAQLGDGLAEIYRARWETLFGRTAAANQRLAGLAKDERHPAASAAASLLALRLAWDGGFAEARTAAQRALRLARIAPQRTLATLAALAVDPSTSAPDAAPVVRTEAAALNATLRGEWQRASDEWRRTLDQAAGGSDSVQREMLAFTLAQAGKTGEAAATIGKQWPLLAPEQMLVYDFLVYPNLFYTRALASRTTDAQKYFDLFLQFSGDRADRFDMQARAKSASRL